MRSLIVVEALAPVIEWHEKGVLPLGRALVDDPRCRLLHGDFFALAASEAGFDPDTPGRRFDAILVDIDHSPDALLDAGSASFYQPDGLRRLAAHLRPGGVFGLWSDALPDDAFTARLSERLRRGARRTGDVRQSAAGPAVHADRVPRAKAERLRVMKDAGASQSPD